MDSGRILIIGQNKDSAYAIRNVFELERFELELALNMDVAKNVLKERIIQLIIHDAAVCLSDDFDLIDFQLDHGLEVPIVMVGGESTGVRRKVRSKRGVRVQSVAADGFKLLDYVRAFGVTEETA